MAAVRSELPNPEVGWVGGADCMVALGLVGVHAGDARVGTLELDFAPVLATHQTYSGQHCGSVMDRATLRFHTSLHQQKEGRLIPVPCPALDTQDKDAES